MNINIYEQQQLIYCWLTEANNSGEHPLVYAGHALEEAGFAVRIFLLRPVKGTTQYGTIHIPWAQVRKDVVRYKIRQIEL